MASSPPLHAPQQPPHESPSSSNSTPTRDRKRNNAALRLSEINNVVREELNGKCCLIRMQYHPITRISFEVIWRLLFVLDLFTDIGLCLQYPMFSHIWWLFLSVFFIPYILSAIFLFLPFRRRLIDGENIEISIVLQILIIGLYSIFSLPCIFILDLYICTRLIITDLSTTRYFLYYWRLKTLIELTFEAIPQTVLLICIGLGLLDENDDDSNRINVQMLYLSLSMSILCFSWYCMLIYYGAQSTQLSIFEYLYKYYIMQGMDMIPYQEAITQNLLSDFILTSENLTLSEWTQLTTDLFCNFSIVKFDITGQQNLHFSLWIKLFESLANNNLITLKLGECFIFHPDNFISFDGNKPKRKSKRLSFKSATKTEIIKKEEYQMNRNSNSSDLSLPNLQLLKAGFQALILNIPSLIVVDLNNNCLSQIFRELIKPISKLKKLKELYLRQNKIGQSDLTENEYNMLFRGCVSLIILDLSDNELNDNHVIMISNAMQKCKNKNQLKTLNKINLNENEISIEGAQQLLFILKQFKKLLITLQHNHINDDVFEDLQSKSAIDILINDDENNENDSKSDYISSNNFSRSGSKLI